jgi:hypothetical protein
VRRCPEKLRVSLPNANGSPLRVDAVNKAVFARQRKSVKKN